MNWRITKTFSNVRSVAVMTIVSALLMTSGGALFAQSNASASDAGPVGTWTVQVTLRDCVTNAPLGPAFNSLVTNHRGGTLSENNASLAFAIGQRTSGHGTWTQTGGHTYLQRSVALILFDTLPNLPGTPGFNPSLPVSPGFFAGWSTITHTVTVDDPDHFSSSGTNAFYKSNGEKYRTGCSTSVGLRFE
jgi:hypothetical protein